MELLRSDAIIKCSHDAAVDNKPSQDLVFVGGLPLLVATDPERRDIDFCPNRATIGVRPCTTTRKVEVGYSALVYIRRRSTVLTSLKGETNGTPPTMVHYTCRHPGQVLVGSTG
jgi:hypothetical protein